VLEHPSAAAAPAVALAAHPAFAAHAFRPHVTAVTASAETVAMTRSVAAMTAASKAMTCFLDPSGSSHMVLSSFT
jgi:hypothetical protein